MCITSAKVINSSDYYMRYLLILIVFKLILTSCSNTKVPPEIEFFENDTIPLKEKIEKVLESDYLSELGFNAEQSQWIQNYYAERKYKPNWINDSMLSKEGLDIKKTLNKSLWFGIPENRVFNSSKKNKIWVEEEIILTAQTATILNDLNNGYINFEEKKYKPQTFVNKEYLDSTLELNNKITYDQILLNQRINDTNYQFISRKLYSFCSSYTLDKKIFEIVSIRKDSINTIPKAKEALISKGYLKKSENDSLTFVAALKIFQQHNGLKQDGVVGNYTSWALNESNYTKVLRTALTMEKMRRNIVYPSKCIRINIPEYKLRLFVNDSLKRIHNIIVGKPENQTPELTSKIHHLVVFPYWNVPHSIASKEILPALKNNKNYLTKNHYKIYKKDIEVNPNFVNWKKIKVNTFPYKVIQQPGIHNSLGIFKFEFHNNYSVYVHDTPTKSLFKTDVRSYSHGCMRCENPIDLGKTILDYDSIRKKRNDLTADSIDSLVLLSENYTIRLKDPVPIFVEYISVYADRESLIFYLDVYKRDEEYLSIMKE